MSINIVYSDPTVLAATIEVAKSQVRRDIAVGSVPESVASFAELHDHVDANYYGDAFETDFNSSDECVGFWNAVQNTVDAWIKAGGHR